MLSFPCFALKENRIILSREELEMRLKEAHESGKSCEVSLYGFSMWYNMEPIEESVILDKVVYSGKKEDLEELAERKLEDGKESVLIYDGSRYLLFVKEEVDSLEALRKIQEPNVKIITNVKEKFVFPGYPNLKTGQLSRVIRKWKKQ